MNIWETYWKEKRRHKEIGSKRRGIILEHLTRQEQKAPDQSTVSKRKREEDRLEAEK